MIDPKVLGSALHHYRGRGYTVLRGVFTPDEVAEMAAAFDRQREIGLGYGATFRHGNLLYRLGEDPALGKLVQLVQWPSYADPVLERYRRDPRFLEMLAPILGRDIKQIINQLHWKPPGASNADFAFHQDVRFRRPRSAYRNLEISYVQTGIAIDAHTKASGAMRLLPYSHLRGELAIPAPAQVLANAPQDAALEAAGLNPAKLVDLALEPGDVALWSVLMVHGSSGNRTDDDRRFYLNGYVRASDCDRGEWAFRNGEPCPLGEPQLVHYEQLRERPEPHYVEE
ncbi:MAG TPA: phytanoyl-CoA dioxygenase family protein [Stellaceae bacterium]|nr:phytanoyl-CoA dioxygenase family protein [Stellaceae bacterium]